MYGFLILYILLPSGTNSWEGLLIWISH
jgi:hypothetical protein